MNPPPDFQPQKSPRKLRRALPWLVFLGTLTLFLLQRCPSNPSEIPKSSGASGVVLQPPPETSASVSETLSHKPKHPALQISPERIAEDSGHNLSVDSLPYVFADPWGGRHFDSVTVRLHCAEDCAILYSLEDSSNLKSYEGEITFRRNTTLWFAGVDTAGRQTVPVRLDYVIEKNPGNCGTGSMPVRVGPREICMDVYEWPNREGALPRAMVNRAEAEDSCRSTGKRLCALDEWQAGCRGPEASRYPYGSPYDARYCSTRQAGPARSGRSPACRSYYGVYDLAGNVWEWTSTPDPDHEDFFLVAGGNWEAAEKATCDLSKYSFYPQNRYPGVGFRCCAEAR